jgi:hypothetical protein
MTGNEENDRPNVAPCDAWSDGWCVSTLPLELFSKLEAMEIEPFRVSPPLSPRWGYSLITNHPLLMMVLSQFRPLATPPISVGFMARAASYIVEAALAKNLPHRSREHGLRTDGFTGKKTHVFYEFGRVTRVGGGSDTHRLWKIRTG